jgi:VIT1/CCC1 family predicted Fe2+/Mn2+ transporter
MTMETFALADHQELAEQSNLTREETFRTRLIQVDRPVRGSVRDPIQHWLRKAFRRIWYHTLTSKPTVSSASQSSSTASTFTPAANSLEDGIRIGTSAVRRRTWRSHQNTARLADAVSRFLFGLLTGALLITPMAVLLGQENDRPAQLITVSISIVMFSLLVALASRASPQETMAASAAYAAVLVVFVSTSNVGNAGY